MRGTHDFARYFGMLIDGLDTAHLNGFAYNTIRAAPDEEVPKRFGRAEELFAGKLWREQLRDWDENRKPTAIAAHRGIQAVDPDALSDEELIGYLRQCRDHHAAMIYQHMYFTASAVVPVGDFLVHVGDWTGLPPAELLGLMHGSARVKGAVALAEARDSGIFGSKAVGLGDAVRDGLPVPPGVAFSGPVVEAVAAGEEGAIEKVAKAVRKLRGPFAVRSSAVDEDRNEASFAGQHLTLLNVPSVDELAAALREIWWSANSDSAITYRQRVGLFARPSVGVVVQSLLDPEVAGVMFTRNPITGADERVIEASWGLGEAVVAGLVIPDCYRLDHSGEVLERKAGLKRPAIRSLPGGGTVNEDVPADLAEQLGLNDDQLGALGRLALRCEQVYGPGRDIEWAFAGGTLYLLQCRAVTAGHSGAQIATDEAPSGSPVEAVQRVQLFSGLDPHEVEQIARLFKQRRFAKGETIIREGSGGAALFLIDSGQATVSKRGAEVATLKRGDSFGEIALIDEGPRAATVTATTDLVCHGLTFWEFSPLVQQNGMIAWKLLQSMVKMLRAAQEDSPIVSPSAPARDTRARDT